MLLWHWAWVQILDNSSHWWFLLNSGRSSLKLVVRRDLVGTQTSQNALALISIIGGMLRGRGRRRAPREGQLRQRLNYSAPTVCKAVELPVCLFRIYPHTHMSMTNISFSVWIHEVHCKSRNCRSPVCPLFTSKYPHSQRHSCFSLNEHCLIQSENLKRP